MAKLIKGDVVVVPFPFSDLSSVKRRPAFVLANLPGSDIILCQITSRFKKDQFVIQLSADDFTDGGLPVESYIRPNRIFTADKKIILRRAGKVNKEIVKQVVSKLIELLRN